VASELILEKLHRSQPPTSLLILMKVSDEAANSLVGCMYYSNLDDHIMDKLGVTSCCLPGRSATWTASRLGQRMLRSTLSERIHSSGRDALLPGGYRLVVVKGNEEHLSTLQRTMPGRPRLRKGRKGNF